MYPFQPSAPLEKLFKDKQVEYVLVCIGTTVVREDVDQVFVCGEDQVFF